jgi:hypothetical protein
MYPWVAGVLVGNGAAKAAARLASVLHDVPPAVAAPLTYCCIAWAVVRWVTFMSL